MNRSKCFLLICVCCTLALFPNCDDEAEKNSIEAAINDVCSSAVNFQGDEVYAIKQDVITTGYPTIQAGGYSADGSELGINITALTGTLSEGDYPIVSNGSRSALMFYKPTSTPGTNYSSLTQGVIRVSNLEFDSGNEVSRFQAEFIDVIISANTTVRCVVGNLNYTK